MTHEHLFTEHVGSSDGMISVRCRCGAVYHFPAAASDRIQTDQIYRLRDGSAARVTSIDLEENATLVRYLRRGYYRREPIEKFRKRLT